MAGQNLKVIVYSYTELLSYNWTCVETWFCQIRSHIRTSTNEVTITMYVQVHLFLFMFVYLSINIMLLHIHVRKYGCRASVIQIPVCQFNHNVFIKEFFFVVVVVA